MARVMVRKTLRRVKMASFVQPGVEDDCFCDTVSTPICECVVAGYEVRGYHHSCPSYNLLLTARTGFRNKIEYYDAT